MRKGEMWVSFVFFDIFFLKVNDDGKDLGFVVILFFLGGMFDLEEKIGLIQMIFFVWFLQCDDLIVFCLGSSDKDVYMVLVFFCICGSCKGSNIVYQWVVYVDVEYLLLDKLKIQLIMVVEMFEGCYYLYWVIEIDDLVQFIDIFWVIVVDYVCDGCDLSGWDVGQFLCVFGIVNNKYVWYGWLCWQIFGMFKMGLMYMMKVLVSQYLFFSMQDWFSVVSDMFLKEDWYFFLQLIWELFEVFCFSFEVYDLYVVELKFDQDCLKMLWKLFSQFFWFNVLCIVVMYIVWLVKCNKYKIDGCFEDELWQQFCKVYDYFDNQLVCNSFFDIGYCKEVDQSEENLENKFIVFVEVVLILWFEECDLVLCDIFVDCYQIWVEIWIDVLFCYYWVGVLMILFIVLGEFGKCFMKFDMNFILWFFIFGLIIWVWKMIVMMMWVDFFDELFNDVFFYLFGFDVILEVLSVILFDCNGCFLVFYWDEVYGLLYEQVVKWYLVGVCEYMMELFIGCVCIVLCVGNFKEYEDCDLLVICMNFLMFLCGMFQQVIEYLIIGDYQFGYFVWFFIVEVDLLLMIEEVMFIEQFDGQILVDDVMCQGLLNDLFVVCVFWMEEIKLGDIVMIFFDGLIWNWFQKVKWELYNVVDWYELFEVLLLIMLCMGDLMMKMVVLLVMLECQKIVWMLYLLKVMVLIEEWYWFIVCVVGKIFYLEWVVWQNEILIVIQVCKEGVIEQDIYFRFCFKIQERDIELDLYVFVKVGLIYKMMECGRVCYVLIVWI